MPRPPLRRAACGAPERSVSWRGTAERLSRKGAGACAQIAPNRRSPRTRLQRTRRRQRRPSIVTHRSRKQPTFDRNTAASSPGTRWRIGSPRKRKWISDCEARAGFQGIRLAKNILVGDVGGTHARFAIVDAGGPHPWNIQERQDLEGQFPTFLDALRTYFERTGAPASGRRGDCRGRSRDGWHRALHQSRLEHLGSRPEEIRLRASGARE